MKKSFLLVGVFVFLLTGGIGCRGLSQEEKTAVQPITLNYWTVFDNVNELKKLADEYKKIRPYIRINIRQLRYEEFDKIFVNALADDVAPDIVSIHTRWLGQHVSRLSPMPETVTVATISTVGTIQPKTVVSFETNRMPSLNVLRQNYLGTVADDAVVGGDIYGLPLTVDSLALIYNKDLLDAAGVAVPPATWTDFLEAVKKATKYDKKGTITQSGVALGTGNNVDNAFDVLSLLMMQNGVTMSRGNRVSFADGFDRGNAATHPTLEALRFYTDFARPTKEVYSWNENFANALDEFARGRVVFYIGFGYDYARIHARAPQLNLALAPIPQLNPTSPTNVANYWLQSVVKKSKYQNESWDFIRFISAPGAIKNYSVAVGQPSPLRAHVADQLEDPVIGPFATQVLNAKNWYHGKDIDAADEAMKSLIARYLAPLSDEETRNQTERDKNLIINTAAVIQQTF